MMEWRNVLLWYIQIDTFSKIIIAAYLHFGHIKATLLIVRWLSSTVPAADQARET